MPRKTRRLKRDQAKKAMSFNEAAARCRGKREVVLERQTNPFELQ